MTNRNMTRSELFAIMVGGMSTVAGSVLAGTPRVVEVKVRLDDSEAVAGLTNLQVTVEIDREQTHGVAAAIAGGCQSRPMTVLEITQVHIIGAPCCDKLLALSSKIIDFDSSLLVSANDKTL